MDGYISAGDSNGRKRGAVRSKLMIYHLIWQWVLHLILVIVKAVKTCTVIFWGRRIILLVIVFLDVMRKQGIINGNSDIGDGIKGI